MFDALLAFQRLPRRVESYRCTTDDGTTTVLHGTGGTQAVTIAHTAETTVIYEHSEREAAHLLRIARMQHGLMPKAQA